jgi:osmotically-inducible protein OsmY
MPRSDEELRARVLGELREDPRVNATRIHVRVEAGVVWLSGSATSLSEVVAAGRAVWQVGGVKALGNGIRVEWPAGRRSS